MNIQHLTRNQATTPSPGQWFLFYDTDNGGALTAKDSNCDFHVIGDLPCIDTSKLDDCVCEALNQITDDAGCALKGGLASPTEYQSIMNNINLYSNVDLDPSTGSYTHNITSTPTLFIQLTTTDVLCNGESTGTSVATVSGGQGPYVMTWADNADAPVNPASLAAGAFKLTVTDANGTVKVISFVIAEPPALVLPAPIVQGTSPSATATANPSGGVSPYTYVWKDNVGVPIGQTTQQATGLSTGTYQVEVTDANGCTIEDTNVVIP